jgi:Phage tail tube protein
MSQQTGKVTVKVSGSSLRSKEGASIQLGGIDRDGDMTDQGEFYFKEKYAKSEVKATLIHCSDSDLVKLRKAKNIPLTFACDSGTVYTVAGAVVATIGELKSGEVEVTFMGPPASES